MVIRRNIGVRAGVALYVMGGYGKGEGGVEWSEGRERLSNNVDLLLLTSDERTAAGARRLLAQLGDQLQAAAGLDVPVDVGVQDLGSLRRAGRRVMWFDLREGHRVVFGPPDLLPRILPADCTPLAWDVEDLVVNRVAPVVLGRLALRAGGSVGALRRPLVRHMHKAVVAMGDALLFRAGQLTWSYREKGRRLEELAGVPPFFRARYRQAVEFRLRPSYDRLGSRRALASWHSLRLAELSVVYPLAFPDGPGASGESFTPRSLVHRALTLLRFPPTRGVLPAIRWLGLCGVTPAGRLRRALPGVFRAQTDGYATTRAAAAAALCCPPDDLDRTFLRRWAGWVDPDLHRAAEAMGISLAELEEVA
jgi:hypothetical protein